MFSVYTMHHACRFAIHLESADFNWTAQEQYANSCRLCCTDLVTMGG